MRNNRKAIKQCRQAGGKNKKKMYKIPRRTSTSIERNESIEGETIEQQIQRMINNGEVLGEEKEMIYTKPSEGVIYGTDIRGDKQEKAIEMTEKVAADVMRRRELKSLAEKQKNEAEKAKEEVEKAEKNNEKTGGNTE